MTRVLLSLLLTVSVQDKLVGAHIGDSVMDLAFDTDGKYSGEHKEKKGLTLAKGTWRVNGNSIDVTVASCKGESCKTYGSSFHAEVTVVGDRAMTVKATPDDAPFATGSYYCHYQACERRVGVEVSAHGAPAPAVRNVVDYLIDKNVGHNVTVVWWGLWRREANASTRVTYCRRDEARAKAAAAAVAQDLSGLSWLGAVGVEPGPVDCLYDVNVQVGDAVKVPAR
jgi:hypothetical protein